MGTICDPISGPQSATYSASLFDPSACVGADHKVAPTQTAIDTANAWTPAKYEGRSIVGLLRYTSGILKIAKHIRPNNNCRDILVEWVPTTGCQRTLKDTIP